MLYSAFFHLKRLKDARLGLKTLLKLWSVWKRIRHIVTTPYARWCVKCYKILVISFFQFQLVVWLFLIIVHSFSLFKIHRESCALIWDHNWNNGSRTIHKLRHVVRLVEFFYIIKILLKHVSRKYKIVLHLQSQDGSNNHQFSTLDTAIIDGSEVCVRSEFDGYQMKLTFGDDTGYKTSM